MIPATVPDAVKLRDAIRIAGSQSETLGLAGGATLGRAAPDITAAILRGLVRQARNMLSPCFPREQAQKLPEPPELIAIRSILPFMGLCRGVHLPGGGWRAQPWWRRM